ncbi:hypothetical protein Pmani_001110 [Petrolisthes manimaculis]|uniref:Uncharacterized protein n=1 Tax=Petrolisthes manimaculis TaxID=1843537 RepID=A0AAE1QL78_9EUCA|nr:hypothetical protein Pmani_001110 [Petrolisthes manimaculis]
MVKATVGYLGWVPYTSEGPVCDTTSQSSISSTHNFPTHHLIYQVSRSHPHYISTHTTAASSTTPHCCSLHTPQHCLNLTSTLSHPHPNTVPSSHPHCCSLPTPTLCSFHIQICPLYRI